MTVQTPPPRGNLVLGGITGIVAGAVLVGAAWLLVAPPPTGKPAPSPSVSASATQTGPVSPGASPTASAGQTPSGSPSASATPTTTPTPTPTQSTHPDVVESLPSGSWITVLDSLGKSNATAAQAVARAAELSGRGHTVRAIDADKVAPLRSGYWAIAVTGASSRDEVAQTCTDLGRAPHSNSCYGRQIG